ncbi:MAG TPA: FAD-dependent monooxygenase [Treponemataceae bacterium]|jgi:uncharacterized FAD-dependent dehydrogenase|nr:FAD-dependent monooxygenase [Treponemataceae bacterium]
MITETTLILASDEEGNEQELKNRAARALGVPAQDITAVTVRKKSIDARHGRVKVALRVAVYIGEQPPSSAAGFDEFVPKWSPVSKGRRAIVVGSGPAGLFAALKLIERGVTPIVLDRGGTASERKRDIARISREGSINPESNYCFGEGGAGTFSDGKLYTRSNKRGDVGRVLSIFHHHGAEPEILTDAHPHIGTDRLPAIVARMVETVRANGGEVRFWARVIDLILDGAGNGSTAGTEPRGRAVRARGVVLADGEKIDADAVILATGHSARDVYALLARRATALGIRALEAKTFAMGVRVEHPRELIDRIQYHGKQTEGLPAATYRLVAQVEGRGVYSFCMCPGGLVVPSATANGEIVVNGMSPSSRNARWSNAAIVVETRPEDVPQEFAHAERDDDLPDDPALAGLRYQRWVEREAAQNGRGQAAPAQRLVDFLAGRDSASLPESSYSPGLVPSRLDRWLPAPIASRLASAFQTFDRSMRGFVCPDALLIAPETRTSSPVRVLRDAETGQSPAFAGLFPAGEGSGYAGGIASSAMDGEKAAELAASYVMSLEGSDR